jgi:hypothetical protein
MHSVTQRTVIVARQTFIFSATSRYVPDTAHSKFVLCINTSHRALIYHFVQSPIQTSKGNEV